MFLLLVNILLLLVKLFNATSGFVKTGKQFQLGKRARSPAMKIEPGILKTLHDTGEADGIIYLRCYDDACLSLRGVEIAHRFPFIGAVAVRLSRADLKPVFLNADVVSVAAAGIVSTCI